TNKGVITGSGTSTDDTSPVLRGSWTGDLKDTETLRIYQGGVLVGTVDPMDIDRVNHTWTMALTGLQDGNTYTFTAAAVDAAGNESAKSSDFRLTVDLTPPTQMVTIDSYFDDVGLVSGNMTNGSTTDDRQPVLNGTISGVPLETGDVVRIYDVATNQLLGAATMNADGTTWSFELPPLKDDTTYSFRAVVADAAGNEGTVSGNFTVSVDLSIIINSQNTLDTTPIVSGYTGFAIGAGEYVEITINGELYSSQNGQVVLDPKNNTWYVQIPDAHVLPKGQTYDVSAVLKQANGIVITTDDTTGELYVGNTPEAPQTPTTTDTANKATAMTIGEDGQWRIFSNMAVLNANGTDITNVTQFDKGNILTGNEGVFGSVTFMDFNRDGLMDIFGEDSIYADGQQAFMYRPGSTQTNIPAASSSAINHDYYAFQVGSTTYLGERADYSGSGVSSAHVWAWYGGTAAYDRDGDGYVDLAYGDNTPNDEEAGQGYDSSFVNNGEGMFSKDPSLVWDPTGAPANLYGERYQA
ncbi:Ig-like domain-containing protein, partial [Trabulsiella odontotermitis]|uniref:Ig-like domain-containing protein n=1 Tax=Trabulsiella odontotermitis TaxID=379893 RepID=UPI001EE00F1C